MKVSEFDRCTPEPLIFVVIGSAIVFLVVLIVIRLKGPNMDFRKTKGEYPEEKPTLKKLALGIPCFVLPVGGICAAYVFGCSIRGKIIASFLGFFAAYIVSGIIVWRMKKREDKKNLSQPNFLKGEKPCHQP